MLRGWPIALIAATGLSAIFAFGLVQTAFTPQAQALFIVFAAVLFLIAAFNSMFKNRAHAKHGGDHAVVFSGRLVGAVTVLAAIAAAVFFWTGNDLSGQKIGRYIDQGAASFGRQAQTTFARLTDGRADEATPPAQG